MSLPNPDAHIVFLAIRAAIGNNIKGSFYQFGIRDGYTLAAAYGCSESPNIKALRDKEGHDSNPMNFYGAEATVTQEVQERIMSTGMPPERLKLVTKDTNTLSGQDKAAVVFVSRDKGVNVLAALATSSMLIQPGTILIIDRWWALDRTARAGFDRWAHMLFPLKDFDNHFEVFHDNGWARAFMMRGNIEQKD